MDSDNNAESSSAPEKTREECNDKVKTTSQKDKDSLSDLLGFHGNQPFTVTVNFDLLQWALFIVALATRFYKLDQPRAVVFDEIFYGRYAAMYSKNTFFFDSHPPLGKMLIALAGHLSGADVNFKYDKIGAAYPPEVPLWSLRCVPAVCGSLLVPVTYAIITELRLSRWTAAVAALLVIMDTALLTQSRFILMEAPLILFIALAVLSYLRLHNTQQRPFSSSWWFWLFSLGVSCGVAISIKYLAFFTILLLYALVTKDFWEILPDLTWVKFCCHAVSRFLALVVCPVILYISVFYIHLSVLYKAGPHDDIMTSAFQASLEGGLAAITRGQPLHIAYGSQITLRSAYSPRPCWLHSHAHVYPIRYGAERGSSHQQQVTCYSYKDVNNWWIVKDPTRESLRVDDPLRPVRHGDVVQLIHGLTSRALNSHDVAAPVSPQYQEVSCYIDYNISFPAQNLWRVEIVNPEGDNTWKTIQSHVRFVHLNTSQAIKMTGRQLPEWGFHQFEVATDKVREQKAVIWNVEEHRYTRTQDPETRERDLSRTEMIPLEQPQLSFWSKFTELQVKMLTNTKDAELEHRFSSHPTEWPLMDRNIAYWYNPSNNAQIHLLGNLVLWLSGAAVILVYGGLAVFYVLRRQRQCWDLEPDEWERFRDVGLLLLGGYLANYAPYYLTDQTLFLHNYLPALYFKIVLVAAFLEHIHGIVVPVPYVQPLYQMAVLAWLTSIFLAYMRLSIISYGTQGLSAQDIRSIQWRPSWDFIHYGNTRH